MARLERPHVLLVEDDCDTREMYSRYLSDSGMTVTEARTGRRALETLRTQRPDVVVTDIAMPEMDGLELSRRLRAEMPTRDVPIIAVSGQAVESSSVPAADMVLEKPCEPARLVKAINQVLNQRRR